MKYLVKNFFLKVSRFIYLLIQKEIKVEHSSNKGAGLLDKLRKEQIDEVWQIFSKDLKTSFRFQDAKSIRYFAINLALKNNPNFQDELFYEKINIFIRFFKI